MPNLLEKVINKKISRRDFIKGTVVVATAATAGVSLTTENTLVKVEAAPRLDADGKWIPTACWHNCGGTRCVLKAYVVDGVPMYLKSDDTAPDSPDVPQQRACAKGRAQRNHVLAADRLKYPMKRKNWSPGGGDKSLRGRDEWERISWDEAITYIVNELNYARRNYGNRSIAGGAGPGGAFLASEEFGGYTVISDTGSAGAFAFVSNIIGIPTIFERGGSNCRMDLRKSETIIMVGMNPVWSAGGNSPYNFYQAKEAGANFVYVGPSKNYSADTFGARWVPVRPGMDTVLFLAVAHTMITEDNPVSNPIIDWDFLNRCTVGFDADHMPADAKLNENFRDYVMGVYDGQPKTPEWATDLCGTPTEDIRWLAREMRKDKKVAILNGYAPARCNDAEDFPQIITTVAAMGGHMGKPGHAAGTSAWNYSSNDGIRLVTAGGAGVPGGPAVGITPARTIGVDDTIMAPDLWEAVLTGKYRRSDAWRFEGVEGIDDREIDIRVLWFGSINNPLERLTGAAKGIEALKKVDFVYSNSLSLNATAAHADIVLPLTSEWERPGTIQGNNRDAIVYPQQVIERLYECKSDFEIGELIAHALGLETATTLYPRNMGLQLLNRLSACTVRNEQGTGFEPLVTLTQEDIDEFAEKWGPAHVEPQQGRISLKEFAEKGVYQLPRSEGDNFYHINYQAFREDPEANPLTTTVSGKIEIYCQTKADMVNAMGRSTIKPYPTYRRVLNGYEDSYIDRENGIKGPYPYQLSTPHYPRRVHSTLDNVALLREAFSNPCYINPVDAAEKGIQPGDTIRIYNQYASTLRPVSFSERLIPGTVEMTWGPWIDVDPSTGIDKAGSCNFISAPVTTGVGISGYNTQLVNFEKYEGEPLVPDHLLPHRIVNI